MSHYSQLKGLGKANIERILNEANARVASNYFSNVSTANGLLDDYDGPINTNAIIRHFRGKRELAHEFERLSAIQFPSSRTQKSHDERHERYLSNKRAFDDEFNRLSSISFPSSRTQKSHDERYERYTSSIKEAKQQIDTALNTIAHLKDPKTDRRIEFNIEAMDEANKRYFNKHIGRVLLKLITSITYNQSWLCYYRFNGLEEKVKMKILYEESAKQMLQQMRKENFISEVEAQNAGLIEENYDFFPGQIYNLASLQFFDINQHSELAMKDLKAQRFVKKMEEEANDPVLQALKASNQPKAVIDAYLATKKKAATAEKKTKQYKTIEGSFWKYILKLPINLERYQIFNELNKDTVEKMTRDNCLIYACIQAGVDKNIISHMREIIRVRSFPQSKLQTIANETHIQFNVSIRTLDENFNTTTTKTTNRSYTPVDGDIQHTINLVLIDGHYMLNENVPVTTYFIEHFEEIVKRHPTWPIERMQKVYRYDDAKQTYKIKTQASTELCRLLKALYHNGYFEPITIGDVTTYSSLIYKEDSLPKITHLEYDEKTCCQLKEDPAIRNAKRQAEIKRKLKAKGISVKANKESKGAKNFTREHVVYADFECSTDGIHKAFNICFQSSDGKRKGSFWGEDCAVKFLDALENNTLVYYHNLSYDINFVVCHLSSVDGTPIIKGSRTMMLAGKYNNKMLCFKDSYTIISKPLKMFPVMFKLQTGAKDIFPYTYYSSTMLANDNKIGNILDAAAHTDDPEGFINNVNTIKGCKLSDTEFDMEVYSNYYCMQDVNILRHGFERFRSDLYKAFNLDAYDYVSICSIADTYMEREVYWKNGNLYDLANTPREFISRCIQGGRCMCADNEKQIDENINEDKDDLDAVSLYPSGIVRLYCCEGKPKVLTPEMCSTEYLLNHLFEDDQVVPTKQRFISSFYVEVEITKIGKERHMPLIVVNPEFNPGLDVPRSSNTCCTMYVNHITLQDLIEFQQCEMIVKRGYYYDGKRDYTIRDVVNRLFELRLKYKKEDNPLQEVIKLILNSIYGKTILKPIDSKIRIVHNNDAMRFIRKNYNSIAEIEPLHNCDFTMFKVFKPIVRHFNFCPLGVDILSMSKRIMNEVFCLAEDNNIKIFYQDTDSGHYYRKDIPVLAELYKQKYGREMIGKNLGQFHTDFAEVVKGVESHAAKSIFTGKKTYVDMLYAVDPADNQTKIGFHSRMKGVTQDVITNTANEMFPDCVQCAYDEAKGLHMPLGSYDINSKFSVLEMYRSLYNGDEIAFDLCKGRKPCFERKNNFTIVTKTSFVRKLKF